MKPALLKAASEAFVWIWLYLVAVMDWFTRKVLAWRISNTLEADFRVEALNEAIHKFGPPEIMNTDSHTIDASSRVV